MNEYELESIHQCLCGSDFENASLCVCVLDENLMQAFAGHCTSEENLLIFLSSLPQSSTTLHTIIYTDCNFLYVDFVYSNKYFN